MNIENPVVYRRPVKGPCVFCRCENVTFNEEHFPPETIVGKRGYVLVDWVCANCNSQFSIEDKYFGTHYHGSLARVLYGVVGKKTTGAEVALKGFRGRFQPKINTVELQIKTAKTKAALQGELATLDQRQPTTMKIPNRTINKRRLGKCLAKMAIETVACAKPEIVFSPVLDDLRDYALGRGKLRLLPFALGASKGVYGAGLFLWDPPNADVAPVALVWIPGSTYAIQLFNFDDLLPLRTVAQEMNLFLDETGQRTETLNLNINLEFPVARLNEFLVQERTENGGRSNRQPRP